MEKGSFPMSHTAYRDSGVDTDEAEIGLTRLVDRITRNWPPPGEFGGVQLKIGYFANVIKIGDIGLAICTDGVGTKAIIATMMNRYDTIGIDCVAVNVNDLICVGARPVSFVDYIAVEQLKSDIIDSIAIGLAKGAKLAGVSISGGETAQLEDVVNGFDLAGTAVGTVPLQRILTGRNLEPGDLVIGIESSGIHSNGFTLARKAFFKRENPLPLDYLMPETGIALGEELLKPTHIYVSEIMEVIDKVSDVKALINITSDGLLNLSRVDNPGVGFYIDDLPRVPEICRMIQHYGKVSDAEMFEVYNMGVGFCIIVGAAKVNLALEILENHHRTAWVIGKVVEDRTKGVEIAQPRLIGHHKCFHER
jgi:phosphoribosylformylglycinamidine cyclo-ligase